MPESGGGFDVTMKGSREPGKVVGGPPGRSLPGDGDPGDVTRAQGNTREGCPDTSFFLDVNNIVSLRPTLSATRRARPGVSAGIPYFATDFRLRTWGPGHNFL